MRYYQLHSVGTSVNMSKCLLVIGRDSPENREESKAEKDVSEDEFQYDPEQDHTSDKEDPNVTDDEREVFKSRKGYVSWPSSPLDTQSRALRENILKTIPVPTRYAVLHAQDIKSMFELFFPQCLQRRWPTWKGEECLVIA